MTVRGPGFKVRAALMALAAFLAGCGERAPGAKPRELRIFHAAGLTPVLDAIRDGCERDLNLKLLAEASGSQTACRKVTELGRQCDLVMLADNELVAALLPGACSWRLDFANDEIVIGIGVRAPDASKAEQNWADALTQDGVRLGRVDENLGPLGYRTLLVWKLQELRGAPELSARLRARCVKVVDDVGTLAPLLKTGELDYAFLYRSSCIAWDIRHIELDQSINLSAHDVDYSAAVVTFEKYKSGSKETVTIRGAPVAWTLTIPDRGANASLAAEFARCLLTRRTDVLEKNGVRLMRKPLFYGPDRSFTPFRDFAEYAGSLK